MVEGQAALDVPVLCEGIDGKVWPVMAQQCWHVTLQATKAALLNFLSVGPQLLPRTLIH